MAKEVCPLCGEILKNGRCNECGEDMETYSDTNKKYLGSNDGRNHNRGYRIEKPKPSWTKFSIYSFVFILMCSGTFIAPIISLISYFLTKNKLFAVMAIISTVLFLIAMTAIALGLIKI